MKTNFECDLAVETNRMDPLCQLISGDEYDASNQHTRFCVAISTSLHSERKVPYKFGFPSPCREMEIAFKTPRATEEVAKKLYSERMTSCHTIEGENIFYFSRSYLSNAAFVYRRDTSSEKIYLEALSSNLGIKDELNSLNLIEN